MLYVLLLLAFLLLLEGFVIALYWARCRRYERRIEELARAKALALEKLRNILNQRR